MIIMNLTNFLEYISPYIKYLFKHEEAKQFKKAMVKAVKSSN